MLLIDSIVEDLKAQGISVNNHNPIVEAPNTGFKFTRHRNYMKKYNKKYNKNKKSLK